MDNCPTMMNSELNEAPWSQNSQKPIKIKGTIYLELSKEVELSVDDYECTTEVDEDGNNNIYYDISKCNFNDTAEQQVDMPKGWEIENMEVEIND